MIDNITINESYKKVIFSAFALQVILLVFSRLILDGGDRFKIVFIGALAFWTSVYVLIRRNPDKPTKFDLEYIKWGPFLLAVATYIIVHIAWAIRGVG